MRRSSGRISACAALALAVGMAGGCRAPARAPAPIVREGYTISLTRVSASQSVDFRDRSQNITVGISVKLDRPEIAAAGPSSYPQLVLHAVQDEDGSSIPIQDAGPNSDAVPVPDLRSFMMLIGAMDTDPRRTVGVGGGGVSGFERMPRSLRLVAGTVQFDRLSSFRTIDVPLATITESAEIVPGLWMKATVTNPRPREMRLDVVYTVEMRTDNPDAVPPLPATIDLLDQHGDVIGRVHRGASRASATKVVGDAQFVGYIAPERRPDRLRIALGSGIEHVSLPFEFRDVPLTLP